MSESLTGWTPSIARILDAYVSDRARLGSQRPEEAAAEFYRWIAERDRELIEQCVETIERLFPLGSTLLGDAPSKIAQALRALVAPSAPDPRTPEEQTVIDPEATAQSLLDKEFIPGTGYTLYEAIEAGDLTDPDRLIEIITELVRQVADSAWYEGFTTAKYANSGRSPYRTPGSEES